MVAKDSHCSYCGQPFADGAPWPRTCAACGQTSYLNPMPVAALLLPVGPGLLTVRRAKEPRAGALSLPGGYIDVGESWQEAAARELFEEVGLRIDPASIRDFGVRSSCDGRIIIFGIAPAIAEAPALRENDEVAELVVIDRPLALAFLPETGAVADYFERMG